MTQLPDELEALERELAALTSQMSGADYHRQGAAQLKTDRERLQQIEHALAAKFERWAALDQRAAQATGA